MRNLINLKKGVSHIKKMFEGTTYIYNKFIELADDSRRSNFHSSITFINPVNIELQRNRKFCVKVCHFQTSLQAPEVQQKKRLSSGLFFKSEHWGKKCPSDRIILILVC